MEDNTNKGLTQDLRNAVSTIKTAILQSQAYAVKAVNQEQLALYYGIGRYISANTRNNKWGTGALKSISEQLRQELPGLRGFSETNLKNMRLFYEAWICIESNSSVSTAELTKQPVAIRQLQLTNYPNFPLAEFLHIGFRII